MEEASVEAFDRIFDLNTKCPLFASLPAADHMKRQGAGGSILNIVSIDALFPAPTEGLYGAAKAALVSLTAAMAVEFGQYNIRVNAIAPGLVETKLSERALRTDAQRMERASFYAIKPVGVPEDIAAAAVFLCSDATGWTSGATLLVAGGNKATSDVFRWLRTHSRVPDGSRM